MCEYLDTSRPTYRFRRVVPKDVQEIIGRPVWWYTLGTKDRGEAKRRCQIEAVRTTALIDEARKLLAQQSPVMPQPLPPLTPEQQARDVAQQEHEQAQAAYEDELAAAEEAMDDRADTTTPLTRC